MDFVEGEILCIDKPLGWTSFDAVKRLRGALTRRLGIKKLKVGHAGTLDPLATGVMIITTGRATKRIEELQAGVKEYIATLSIGATTPSFDLETPVDATYSTAHITQAAVEQALEQFHGRIEQVPPAYSAIKINGKRAYEMARKGKTPELKPKILVIDEITLMDFHPDTENPERLTAVIRVVCSKGTYIRALARDIGAALGSGAHLTALRRTRVGDITLEQCMDIPTTADLIHNTPIVEHKDNNNDNKTQENIIK